MKLFESSPKLYTFRDLHAVSPFEHVNPMGKALSSLSDWSQADMIRLLQSSVAEESAALVDYIEAGQQKCNADLRSMTIKTKNLPSDTALLLMDLDKQVDFSRPAARAVHVMPSAVKMLSQVGRHVIDFGLQSASPSLDDVQGWHDWNRDHNPGATVPIILIFDETIAKKNLASGFLSNHVVVPPCIECVVRDVSSINGVMSVLLGKSTSSGEVFNCFDGKVVERVDLDNCRNLIETGKAGCASRPGQRYR